MRVLFGIFATSSVALAQLQIQNAVKPARPEMRSDTNQAYADSVHWMTFEEGIRSSREDGKPVFLFCYGSWCGYCKKMLTRTFHDSTVVKCLNASFIPIKIETQSQRTTSFRGSPCTEAQLAKKEFGVTAVPCVWLLESDGCRIKKIKGYYPAKYLLPELQAVCDHTYGKCQDVSIVDPTSQPAPPDTSSKSKLSH